MTGRGAAGTSALHTLSQCSLPHFIACRERSMTLLAVSLPVAEGAPAPPIDSCLTYRPLAS